MNTRFSLSPPTVEFLFSLVLFLHPVPLDCIVRFPGDPSPCWPWVVNPGVGPRTFNTVQNLHCYSGSPVCGSINPVRMGFDFIIILPLLLSHCCFSFVLGLGTLLMVGSSIFLTMVVHQLVAILVLSFGVRRCTHIKQPLICWKYTPSIFILIRFFFLLEWMLELYW